MGLLNMSKMRPLLINIWPSKLKSNQNERQALKDLIFSLPLSQLCKLSSISFFRVLFFMEEYVKK
jgi:hypothetical protein